ncbi:MAG: hypothetical protein ABI543_09690 [Ignavibacteria bacterium]
MAQWTKPHLGILKRNYSTKGAKYVSKKTGHPESSVVIKANSLGIKSASIRRWTEFELKYILKNYGMKKPDSIARSLKRSVISVESKARYLKIYVPKPTKKWPEAELVLLRKLWVDKKFSAEEVARKLNKTYSATHHQAWKMGLRRPGAPGFWSEEDTLYLRRNYKKKTYRQIAEKLGMTTVSVFKKALRLGLRLRGAPVKWKESDNEYIRSHYGKISAREIAGKLNRSYESIITRAGLLGVTRKKKK